MTPLAPDETLRVLIGDVDEATFFAHHYDRAPLHVRGAPERFSGLYDVAAFWSARALRELDAATRDARGQHVQLEILPAQMRPMFDAGMTLCADVSLDLRVARLLAGLKSALCLAGPPAFAKMYASPEGSGFAVHADAHHVFVLQLEGKKRWRYTREPAVRAPLAPIKITADGEVVHAHPLDGVPVLAAGGERVAPPSNFEEVVLVPGDSLYLPPGTWHEARAIGESYAISVSPPRAAAFDVVTHLLRDAFASDPEWRRDLTAPPSRPELGVARVKERLAALAAALAHLPDTEIARLWCEDIVRDRPAFTTPPSHDARDITRTTTLERVDPAPLIHYVDADLVCFYAAGEQLTFPAEALPFIEALARHKTFTAEDTLAWDETLTWPDARATLEQLVSAGVLRARR